MPNFTFRNKRTGKTATIGGADTAGDALKALTMYPDAWEYVDGPCRKSTGIADGNGRCISCGADHIVDCRKW